MTNKLPEVGQKVKLIIPEYEPNFIKVARITEVYERIDVWWETAQGENKMGLEEALEQYGPEKAATAEWYAMVVDTEDDTVTMAVASFECELIDE